MNQDKRATNRATYGTSFYILTTATRSHTWLIDWLKCPVSSPGFAGTRPWNGQHVPTLNVRLHRMRCCAAPHVDAFTPDTLPHALRYNVAPYRTSQRGATRHCIMLPLDGDSVLYSHSPDGDAEFSHASSCRERWQSCLVKKLRAMSLCCCNRDSFAYLFTLELKFLRVYKVIGMLSPVVG